MAESRSLEDINIDVHKRYEEIRNNQGLQDIGVNYFLELLYKDVSEFMEGTLTWMRTREEMKRTGNRIWL